MLNAIHSKWLPSSKLQPTANHGQNPKTTTTTTTKSQIKVLPTTTQRTETTTNNRHRNQNHHPATKQFIQLKATQSLPKSGRTVLVKRQLPQHRPAVSQRQKPSFLRNYEILNQESLTQLLNQNLLLNQNQLLNPSQLLNQTQLLNAHQLLNQAQLLNQLNQRATSNRILTIPKERIIQLPPPTQQEEDQETTPVYTIISVPFLARSFLPTPSMKQRKLKANGLIKTKQVVVNANERDGQTITLCPEQSNISAHLNLLDQQQQQKQQQQQQSKSRNQLNTTTVKSLNTTPISLNTATPIGWDTTTRIPTTTTSSGTMMGIQLPGNEFQDMNGALQIAAVEELAAPVCLDDYFIENNNNSNFDANKGTYKLNGLNEMTINQMNVDFANQLQTEDQEEQLMREVPGEEELFNKLRLPYSEELVSLTQPSLGHETLESESLFAQHIDNICNNNNNEMITINCEDSENSSSYIANSPLPTENDCIAISELHHHKYMDDNCNIMQDDETSYRIEFSPEPSHENSPSDCSNSTRDEKMDDIEHIYKQLVSGTLQQTANNLKRNSSHLSNPPEIVKKSKPSVSIPRLVTNVVCGDGLVTDVLPTPDFCDMVDGWLTEVNDTSEHSYSSSPSWSATSFAPPDFILDPFVHFEPKLENPPSIASSFIYEEPSCATPSPSDSSSCTLYSTNPNSPAFSVYGSGSTRKRRGRPPKQHSDLPDPEIWNKLPEADRKRYEDRCKNNEASRQSRQKNKEKQLYMLAEEEREQRRNNELQKTMRILERQQRKLKEVLFKQMEKCGMQ